MGMNDTTMIRRLVMLTGALFGVLVSVGFCDDDEAEDVFTLADLEEEVDKSEDGNYQVTVFELFYAADDEPVKKVISGLGAETVGKLEPIIGAKGIQNPKSLRFYARQRHR